MRFLTTTATAALLFLATLVAAQGSETGVSLTAFPPLSFCSFPYLATNMQARLTMLTA